MRATLTFDLSDPDDRDAHAVALAGSKYRAVVVELDEHLRSRIKYQEDPVDVRAAIFHVRETLREFCQERGLNPWEEEP